MWPENGWQRPDEPPSSQRTRWSESSYPGGVYAPGDEYETVVQSIVSEVAKRAGSRRPGWSTMSMSLGGPPAGPRCDLALARCSSQRHPRSGGTPRGLIGRDAERGVLDRLLDDVRGGASRALVVHGEAGMGKTALLEYVAGRASDCRVVSVAGAQAEMEFGFAALHQLCVPVLDHLDAVPAPQRKALNVTFGIGGWPGAGPVLGGPGRAEPAGGGGDGTATHVPDRRRAVAGPGLGAGVGIRGAPPGDGVGRVGVRGPYPER